MTAPRQEHVFSTHLVNACTYHARMLSDANRNLAIKTILDRHIRSSTRFMDVGSGTGIWAIYAANLGASRVVAVETEEALIPLIYKHAEENGVADKVEIVHGDINHLGSEDKFDVILSELFSSDVYGEATTQSFIRLRENFLADGGVLLPQSMELKAVPLRRSRSTVHLPAGVDVSMHFLEQLRQNYSKVLTADDRKGLTFAAEPKLLTTLDYLSIKEPLPILPLVGEWKVEDLSSIDAFLCFTVTRYGDDVKLDSMGSSTWLLERFDFVPFEVGSGTIRFSLTMDPNNTVWSVSLVSNPTIAEQTYSPVFAFTRAKMALAATPHIKLESREKDS